MKHYTEIGKREFIQHTSKYIKLAEIEGKIIITHHGKAEFELVPLKKPTLQDLRGCIRHLEIIGNINEPVLVGYDEW